MKQIRQFTGAAGISAFFIIVFFLHTHNTFSQSQNVGINYNGAAADASALLDISAAEGDARGLLIPRVALTATNSASPITSPVNSLLVYNTATAGSVPNNVVPGYYFWDNANSKWVNLQSSTLPDTYVAFGSGSNTFTGSSGLKFLDATKVLAITNTVTTAAASTLILNNGTTISGMTLLGSAHAGTVGGTNISAANSTWIQGGTTWDKPLIVGALPTVITGGLNGTDRSFRFDNTGLRIATNASANTTSSATLEVNGTFRFVDGNEGANKVLTSDADGDATWQTPSGTTQWTTTGSDIYYNTGKVGIGTNTPSAPLEVYGEARISNGAIVTKGVYGLYFGDGSTFNQYAGVYPSNGASDLNLKAYSNGKLHIGFGGLGADLTYRESMTFLNSGNVGIGNTTPTALLTVGSAVVNHGSINFYQFGYGAAKTNTSFTRAGTLAQSNEASNPFALYLAVTGAASDGNRIAHFQTGVEGLNNTGNITLQGAGGNVGIRTGTVVPATPLHISTTNGFGLLLENSSSSNKRWHLNQNGNDFFIDESAVASVMTFKAGGNVGIGTVSPSNAKLEVVNAGGTQARFAYDTDRFIDIVGNGGVRLRSTDAQNNPFEITKEGLGDMTFKTGLNGATAARMTIKQAGNVEIGGTLAFGASSAFNGANLKLSLYRSTVGTYQELISMRNDNVDATAVLRRQGISFNLSGEASPNEFPKMGALTVESGSQYANSPAMYLWTGNEKRLTILSTGEVGIGTTSPSSVLHLKAGTSTAGTAPLKLSTGTVTTTAEVGAMEYQTPKLLFTNGGGIRQEIPLIQHTRVTSDFSKTNTTLDDITGLSVSLAAGKIYRFEATLFITCNNGGGGANGGYRLGTGGTATASLTGNMNVFNRPTSSFQSFYFDSQGLIFGTNVDGSNSYFVKIEGVINVSAAGTFTIKFAENTAFSPASKVLANSYWVVTEMQ